MSRAGDSFNIPHYLKAGSPEGLRLAMLNNNMLRGKEYDYYQIIYDGKSWFAWFYERAAEAQVFPKPKK
jgi:hypothetical protein